MKALAFLISILLISNIFSSSECESKESPSGAKDCKGLKVSSGDEYCCYFKYTYKEKSKEEEAIGCGGLSKAEYDDIKKTIEDIETRGKENEVKMEDLDCKNDYIKFCLLSLITLIIL